MSAGYFVLIIAIFLAVVEGDIPNTPPRFVDIQYTATLKENEPVGTNVVVVSAVDNDGDQIYYELGNEAAGRFKINMITGQITSNQVIDREKLSNDRLEFNAYAYDNATVSAKKVKVPVSVFIGDVNDNAPKFQNTPYKLTIKENALGATSFAAKATDADIGRNALIMFSITGGDDKEKKFGIGPYTGTVSVIQSLDYEKQNSYNLTITAKNEGLFANTFIAVEIQDIDDLPAVFNPTSYSASTSESAPKGTYVTTVTARDGDRSLDAPVEYLIDPDSNPGSAFTIINTTGVITVNNQLDRETIPLYNLRVGAKSTIHKAVYATVTITIVDVNDNSPKFIGAPYKGTVPENSPNGLTVLRVTAQDADAGSNAVFAYSLSGASSKFSVNSNGDILVSGNIDRETQAIYNFEVKATETSTSEKYHQTAKVTINVTDVNDNNPACKQAVYQVTVQENKPNLTQAAQVKFDDADLGSNAVVRFSFVQDSSKNYQRFTIDPITGNIRTMMTFDREVRGIYSLSVRVTDQPTTGQGRTGECSVIVSIGDENDNIPEFNNLPNTSATVSEGAATNTLVYTVKASDKDTGINAALSFTIESGNGAGVFAIHSSTGVVTTAMTLDRETVSQYTLGIKATDGGGKSVTSTLVINVLDINDNTPVFSQPNGYEFHVNEGTVGLVVGTVKATDKDEGSNSAIVYSLKAVEDYAKFNIDNTRGVITTSVSLDRETASRHTIQVIAKDSGNPPLSSDVRVTVNVTDINDHRPKFSQHEYTVTVVEKTSPRVILTVTASDADLGTNAALAYYIESGNIDNYFGIDLKTGAISTLSPLDREDKSSYTMKVVVKDLSGDKAKGIPLRDSAIVKVTVQDINDNTPVFSQAVYTLTIPENTEVGKDILRVTAVDSDDGINRVLQYSITSGNSLERFFIDMFSGVLYVKSSLDRDPPRNEGSFTLTIQAADKGNASRKSTAKVVITVSDVNDSPPEFTSRTYTVSIPENITSGTVILKPTCVDRDLGTNGQISYSLHIADSQASSKFNVNSQTGFLSVSGGFDYDTLPRQYVLTITAKDAGSPSLSGNATVTVNLENVNDNYPVFTKNRYTFNVKESSYVDRVMKVGTVKANDVDGDTSIYGKITYSFVNQSSYYRDHYWLLNDSSIVDIMTGVAGRLVGEAKIVSQPGFGHVVSLNGKEAWIRVGEFEKQCISDPSLCPRGITTSLWLQFRGGRYIISSGGQSEFGAGFAFFYVRETRKFTLLIATLKKKWEVVLNDIPKNWYYFTFTWSSSTGLKYYENGRLVQSTSSVISVSRASDAFTVFTVGKPNNINKLDYYGNLSVSDLMIWKQELTADEVLHSYQISRHVTGYPMPTFPQYVSAFGINPATGEIDAIGLLDRETKSNYTLDVSASDRDPVHPRLTTTVVFVEILDTNDNSPIFDRKSYVVDMIEHSSPGKTVVQVQATDKDISTNGKITYRIVSGNTGDSFAIDGTSGVISPKKDIDREIIQQFLLGVQARDGGKPVLQSTVQVTINIVDVNDNVPLITLPTSSATVQENKPKGQTVLKLTVVDKDHNQNGEIQVNVNNNKFTVDSSNNLVTTQVLDRESQSHYDLKITATDKGNPPKSSSVDLKVKVLDENDNVPQFTKSLYRAAISENMTVGSKVLQVSASDPDEGSNGDIAYSIQGSHGSFAINSTSGVISVTSLVDREAHPNGLSIAVMARDHGYPKPETAIAYVNITISDINDNAPIFDKFNYVGVVREDAKPGTVVAAVRATDRDEGLAGMILYSITGGDPQGLFQVLNQSGNITVAKPLDRETKDTYEIQVTATDRAGEPKSASVEVDITITDANDNHPTFVNVVSKILVSESALPGTPVFTVLAADRDVGVNSQVRYAGHSPEGAFEIDAQSGVIKTKSGLDYEKIQRYAFFVVAMDKGHPQLNSTKLQLNITVVDANDNNPQFDKANYIADISEAAKVGDFVIKVSATEKDSGLASVIGYNISAGDENGHFNINLNTGKITVRKPLDREKQPTYTLLITAKDSGTPPRYGQATVAIRLTDINDRPPVFKFKDYQKEIPENSPVGFKIITVEAEDEDTPQNTKLTYSITNGNIDDHFTIKTEKTNDKYVGLLKVAKPLDRESVQQYSLNVSVSDQLHTGYARIEIRLSDVNDRNPEFNSSVNYTADVAENTQSDQLVITVMAKDYDLGSSADITYSISDGDGHFKIGSKTGEIRTSSLPLNRESKPSYKLLVTATDPGGLKGFKHVYVQVLDKNDNAPVFHPSAYTVTYTEGPGTSGMKIADVNATDADEGANKDIEYSFASGNIGDAFSIDSKTGIITTAKVLDREATGVVANKQGLGVYKLTVRARDHGNPIQSTITLVTVLIHDINDNPPVFPVNGYKTMISEGAKANQDVIAAIATDKDTGENSRLTYELISGNTGGDFKLDPDTGMIKTARNLERQQTFSYNLTIGAADHGRPSFSATTRVAITVGDLNDNTPVFKPQNYSISVTENSPVGTHLLDVQATDADSGQNAFITYTITDGDPMKVFKVETQPSRGKLIVAANIDREYQARYNLTITATDGGVPVNRKAKAIVLITVQDLNDNPPQFSRSPYTATVDENSGPGTPLKMSNPIKTMDADVGVNADIRYHLNGTDSIQFEVDSTTGVITTRRSPPPMLDYEKVSKYIFHVVAVDKQGKGHATYAKVTVQIIDTNDNTPKFVPPRKSVSISEDSAIGSEVTKVTATDPDTGLNGRIFYSIISGSEGKFDIERVTGVLRVSASLDRESRLQYSLNISAIDGSYYPNEGYGEVIVILKDVNDNKPRFTKPTFSVEILENTPIGSVIVNVTATDPDHGTNAQITYSMIHAGFDINAHTGSVTSKIHLDREKTQTFSFTVTAKDGKGMESSVPVNVVIKDENDNAPQFPTVQYHTDVMERTSIGTIVLSVKAEDRDIGDNGRISYSLTQNKADLFAIDKDTGLITVAKVFNRVQLKQSGVLSANGSYEFIVQARDLGVIPRSSNVTVIINIVDLGDDSPVFNSSSYVVNVRENQPPGTNVLRLTIAKQRPGTTLTYSIVSSQNAFDINKNTGMISTKVPLDREVLDNYLLTAKATDNGQTRLSGYTSVAVHVTDDNDHAPDFQFPAPYKMTVEENAKVGTSIGSVKAVDGDNGSNADFVYSITHANIGPGLKMVEINKDCATPLGLTNGDVKASDMTASSTYVIPNEDYSPTQGRLNNMPFKHTGVTYKGAWCASNNNEQQYLQIDFRGIRKVTKIATQGRPLSTDYVKSYSLSYSIDGTLPFTEHGKTFLPGNTNGDGIKTNFILPAFHARYVRIKPKSWTGRICLRVEFYGCESTGKDEVILPFIIDPNNGTIETSSKLDREQQSFYNVIVEAKDKGIPSLNSTTTLEISLIDNNDNHPKFSKDLYEAFVPENAYGGYQIIRITATDADRGNNARITYAIVIGGNGRFIIEETSGIVRPSGYLDYESMPIKHYILNVSASDDGRPRLTAYCLLKITVTDFNDNKPTFNKSSYVTSVSEDAVVGTTITTITAKDLDSGFNAQINYTSTGYPDIFHIVLNTGEVKLGKAIDRESQSEYILTITALDRGTPTLSSSAKLTIRVLDVNDNPPIFTSRIYRRTISEGVAIGTIIMAVEAKDADIGDNGKIRYEISHGNNQGIFSIDNDSGAIRLAKPFNREANATIKITVAAKDQGKKQLSDHAGVLLTLTDVNDNAPVIHPKKMTALVEENLNAGAFVIDVNATDDDINSNGVVKYAIMHGSDNMFDIDENTGKITTKTLLNRETKDLFTLIVMARDQGTVPYMDFGTIDVHVVDVNDNTPVFIKVFGPFEVKENQSPGELVGQVSASDIDIGTNRAMTYGITGGDKNRDFKIDEKTGQIITAKPLDREKDAKYDLTITVTNNDTSPKLSSSTVVKVNVLDLNDKVPEFTSSAYNRTLLESSPTGTKVVTVSAVDKDEGTNGRVLYRIRHDLSSRHSDVFNMNAETGEMTLQLRIDDQEYRTFTVMIEAKDIGTPVALSSMAPVYITVLDVNDNSPLFQNKIYSAQTTENAAVGTKVLQISASDKDESINGKITYKILRGNDKGHFEINKTTGIVTIASVIDRETTSSFQLIAGAYNEDSLAFNKTTRRRKRLVDANGRHYDTTEVNININDINDNAPVFVRPLFVGGIPEGADLNTYIKTISASDADAGNYSVVSYRILSGNEGGFFSLDANTGKVYSASLFQDKKGQRFNLKVSAFDNNGRDPFNDVREPALLTIYVLLEDQRITLKAAVKPELIEQNKDEFVSVLSNITEAEVYIEQIFRVNSVNAKGESVVESEIVFHAIKESTQAILTNDEVLRTIDKYSGDLNTMYAKWKIKAVTPKPTEDPNKGKLTDAELALIILGGVVALLLIIILICVIRFCVSSERREMYRSPEPARRFANSQPINRTGSWAYYNDVITNGDNKDVTALRIQSERTSPVGSTRTGRNGSNTYTTYLLNKKRLSQNADDKIWSDGDYYLTQDPKIDSYLDDDGTSHKSDSSRPSTSRSPRDAALEISDMHVTKV